MPIVNGYATLEEFQSWAQIPDPTKSDQMSLAVNAASRAIDEHCQRRFFQEGTVPSPVSKVFEVIDCHRLKLGPFRDLVSITSLKTDETGDGTFETTWAAADFELGPIDRPPDHPFTQIDAVAGRLFPAGGYWTIGRRARVEITGVWGWAAVPVEVKQACLIKATRLLTRMQSPNGIAGLDQFGPVRISRSDDPDVVMLLEPLRHPSAGVLVA